MNEKRLICKQDDKMILGVAGGIAEYLNIDPTIVRLIFVLMLLTGGHGLIIYLILAIVMPSEYSPTTTAKANGFSEEEIIIRDA